MPHPFQCLLYCPRSSKRPVLVAAAGQYIHTFDIGNGAHLFTWPTLEGAQSPAKKTALLKSQDKGEIGTKIDKDDSDHAAKRQKLSPVGDDSESSSAEIVVEDRTSKVPKALNPPILKLIATRNGQSVIAVTGEDKCVHVFELTAGGILNQRSERYMPKRPCALAMTPDDSTILCADKFGDVYALPLLDQTYETTASNGKGENENASKGTGEASEPFIPSATSLTVHTKRNRDALRQQQRMAKKTPQKKPMNFEHQLILGHVSLLTDIACASLETPTGKLREYILSADRDEHIRISRGIPQAYMIEGYCLGHTRFVSKLCLLPHNPQLMVSGGGDDYLLLWDWPSGQVKQRMDLRNPVSVFKKRHMTSGQATRDGETFNSGASGITDEIAVSNICTLSFNVSNACEPQVRVIVTIESVPALFVFAFTAQAGIEHLETQAVEGNVIDLAVILDSLSILCSMDALHEPFSTTAVGTNRSQSYRPFVVAKRLMLESPSLHKDVELHKQLVPAMEACVKAQPFVEQKNAAKGKSLKELLYGLESLRKRGSDDVDDTND